MLTCWRTHKEDCNTLRTHNCIWYFNSDNRIILKKDRYLFYLSVNRTDNIKSRPNHHSGGLQRLMCILAPPEIPCHTRTRVFWFLVDTIQIGVMTIFIPPSVSVWSCTVTTRFVVIAVLCGKHHPVVISKWIL